MGDGSALYSIRAPLIQKQTVSQALHPYVNDHAGALVNATNSPVTLPHSLVPFPSLARSLAPTFLSSRRASRYHLSTRTFPLASTSLTLFSFPLNICCHCLLPPDDDNAGTTAPFFPHGFPAFAFVASFSLCCFSRHLVPRHGAVVRMPLLSGQYNSN